MSCAISRVLMTGDAVGGVFTYALALSRALGERGIDVVLAIMGRPLTPDQRREVARTRTLKVVERPYKLEWMQDPWADVERAGEWLLCLEQSVAPEMVHLNGYAHGVLPFRAPVLVVGHSCVLSWWQAVKGEPAPASFHTYRERVRAGLRAADAVVAPTRAMLDALARHYGPLAHASVIHNGSDPVLFAPERKEPFVFAAGRFWDAGKNLTTLARAAERIRWPVYAAGDDRAPPGVGERCETQDDTAIRRLGALAHQDVARWLGRASIYALPARYEPFGLSVLEAAWAGCALVLGDIASLRELWEGAALFVSPADERAWGDALQTLIESASLRESLAERARLRAQRYSLAALSHGYLGVYRTLAAHGRGNAQRKSPAPRVL